MVDRDSEAEMEPVQEMALLPPEADWNASDRCVKKPIKTVPALAVTVVRAQAKARDKEAKPTNKERLAEPK
jgi:hypothetical protein